MIRHGRNRNRIAGMIPFAILLCLRFQSLLLLSNLVAVAGLDSIKSAAENANAAGEADSLPAPAPGRSDSAGNQERVWGAGAATATAADAAWISTTPDGVTVTARPASEEAKPAGSGGTSTSIEEKGMMWGGGGSPISVSSKPYVADGAVEPLAVEKVEAILIQTEATSTGTGTNVVKDHNKFNENSSPEKNGGTKRAWGASETETIIHEKPVGVDVDVERERNGSDSSSVQQQYKASPDIKQDSDESATGMSRVDNKRLWGSHDADHPPRGEGNSSESDPSGHIPFIAPKHWHSQHNPPEGFNLAARVYIGDDKLAHFDYDDDKRCAISLPYFDCGASGTTTAALPVKHAYFRHSLSAPTVWVDHDMHPALAIALSPFTIELDSGESLELRAGDVVLLEDSIRPGHRMIVSDSHSLSVLFVTLPQPHYHTGKQHLSLKKVVAQKTAPCPEGSGLVDSAESKSASSIRQPDLWDARRIRTVALGTVALSISTLAADFLGKTAPLWLAVGVGGTCFVVGSTYGLTVAGDHVFAALELWRERRRLEKETVE